MLSIFFFIKKNNVSNFFQEKIIMNWKWEDIPIKNNAQSSARKDHNFKITTVFSHISTLNACFKHELGHGKSAYSKGRLIMGIHYITLFKFLTFSKTYSLFICYYVFTYLSLYLYIWYTCYVSVYVYIGLSWNW